MSTVTRPRGPLPRRVYWGRRLLVLVVALSLVYGISHLLGGDPTKSDNPSARPASASQGSPSAGRSPSSRPTGAARDNESEGTRGAKAPLAVPTGPCADDDVRVDPSVDSTAFAGSDVAITLNLTTLESPACTWEVSPDSVVVKLTSGSDRIWSTQDCPAAIEAQSVIVRKDAVTKVDVTWSGQRSDDDCTRTTLWAQPGYYFATAAALGAEPAEQQFELLTPLRPTITPTPTAKPDKKATERAQSERKSQQRD